MSRLIDRLFAVHDSLEKAGYPHAFGGAIALAYCTREPRGTRDLDINVFTPPAEAKTVFSRLPAGISVDEEKIATAVRDGQVRLWWEDTPLDVFLSNMEFHARVADRIREVPLAGRTIPVLDCASLAVFKAYFDRGRDWVDIETMAERDPAVTEEAAALVGALSGEQDHRRGRLLRIASRARRGGNG